MLESYGIETLLHESNNKDSRQFASNLSRDASRSQDLTKVKYFRIRCAAYNRLERRLGLGFIFGLPDGIWKEREYLFLRYMS